MSGPWASSHARASWEGRIDLAAAISSKAARRRLLVAKLASWKRGLVRRKSLASRFSGDWILPVRKPRPSGL